MIEIIVFDTETTGLIDNMAIPLKEQPRIIELFAQKLIWKEDDGFYVGDTWHSLFKVRKMEDDAIKTHGITLDMLRNEPEFAERFASLCDFFLGVSRLVGHNLSFDVDQLWMEVRRLGKERAFPWPPIHIDTVEATEGMDGFRLGLSVLHQKLFGEGFDEAHRAAADVGATARCFMELVNTGVIKL